MPRTAILLPLTFGLLLPCRSVLASPVRIVYSSQAEGINSPIIRLRVGPGSGVNITLPDGETTKKAFIDDMSSIGISSDGNLCPWSNQENQQQTECKSEEPSLLHLHQINRINFRYLPHSADGGTLLTVRAHGVNSRGKTYLFQIVPVPGLSEFSNLKIVSDSEKPSPLFPPHPANASPRPTANNTQQSLAPTQPTLNQTDQSEDSELRSTTADSTNVTADTYLTTSTKATTQPSEDANALAFGLLAAIQKGVIKPQTILWVEAQNTLMLLHQGISRADAVRETGLEPAVLSQLIGWGQSPHLIPQQPIVRNDVQTDSQTSSSTNDDSQKNASTVGFPVNSSVDVFNGIPTSNDLRQLQLQSQSSARKDANVVALGLLLAKRKGQIAPNTSAWKQTQKLIVLLRQGVSRFDAVQETGMETLVLNQLLEYGQTRLAGVI